MLARFLRAGGARFGLLALQTLLQLLQFIAESIRAVGELLRVHFLVLRGFCLSRVGELAVTLGDVLRFILERLHRAFEGGTLQHLGRLLELLAQALLHRLQIL